jgi:hypothetical protein
LTAASAAGEKILVAPISFDAKKFVLKCFQSFIFEKTPRELKNSFSFLEMEFEDVLRHIRR